MSVIPSLGKVIKKSREQIEKNQLLLYMGIYASHIMGCISDQKEKEYFFSRFGDKDLPYVRIVANRLVK